MVAWAALAGAGASLGAGLLGSSASKDAASAMKKTAKRQLKFAKTVFADTSTAAAEHADTTRRDAGVVRAQGRGGATSEYRHKAGLATTLRNSTIKTAEKARNDVVGAAKVARNASIGAYGDARDNALSAYGDAYGTARGDIIAGRDAAIAEWRPTADAGTNALAAYDFNLGIGDKPRGYTGPALSAGEKFIRDEGMTTVEGSAASLNSGATLEALLKLGSNVASTSRDRQQTELMARGQLGQNALTSIAGIQTGAAGDLATLGTNYGDRVAGAHDAYGTRVADAQQYYGDRAAGAARNYFTDTLGANSAYTAGMGAARSGLTDRFSGLNQAWMGDVTNAGVAQLNALSGAGSNLGAAGANAFGNMGNAGAAGAIGSANAWTDAINTGFGVYGALGGGAGGSNYSTGGNGSSAWSLFNGGVTSPVSGPLARPIAR